jgi:hypothetical protein
MSDWWVRAHWGRAFEIVNVAEVVHGQSWALLERRDVQLTREDLERPADDPASTWRFATTHDSVDQVRREYESSLSWRLTRPVRAAGRIVRSLRGR